MKEKKNIDSIFNQGFNKLEATPSPRVWENIQAELNKDKKERKVIPLWIKLGGVAALLALLLTVGNSLYHSTNTKFPSVSDENVIHTEKDLQTRSSELEKGANQTQIASEEQALPTNTDEENRTIETTASKGHVEEKPVTDSFKNTSEKTSKTVLAANGPENEGSKVKEGQRDQDLEKFPSKNTIKEGVAQTEAEAIKADVDKTGKQDRLAKKAIVFEAEKEAVVVNEAHEKISEKNRALTEEERAKDANSKRSIFDAIAEKDETAVPKKKKKHKPEHRWNVAPNVAPVYYSSLGNGSSIDPTFADNPQKGDINMSYGVQVSYALNNRLSVRTGVNNVDLSYSTGGIEIGTGPVGVALRSVDYGGREIVVTAFDKGALTNSNSSNDFGAITPKSTQGDARLIQNINYYEVPVELKYAVINTKLGVNLIGGVSTLFLGNNEISVKADNFNSVLGEANNLATVSFSTNIGLGLDYKLSKKFTFNIEPMFKYQLNPYTNSSVSFKPYYLGVYSGLSFKF